MSGNAKFRFLLKPIFVALFVFIASPVICEADWFSPEQPWANIDGFRSAKFGMPERDLVEAIKRDFGIEKYQISRVGNQNEKTVSLVIEVKKLLPRSGTAKIFYILGYKSKRLMHINIAFGRSVTQSPDAEAMVETANQLRNSLAKKKYQKQGFALNSQLREGVILVFQGKDKKGRAARLLLNNPKNKDGKVGDNIALTLSYIEKPENPDVFRIKDGDF